VLFRRVVESLAVIIHFKHKLTVTVLEGNSDFRRCGVFQRVVHRFLGNAVQVPCNLCIRHAHRFRTLENASEISAACIFRQGGERCHQAFVCEGHGSQAMRKCTRLSNGFTKLLPDMFATLEERRCLRLYGRDKSVRCH
jgi:hypothetical protein